MKSILKTIVLLMMFLSIKANALDALVVVSSTQMFGLNSQLETYIRGRLVGKGYTVTTIDTVSTPVPTNLTGYRQIWDIRFQSALISSETTNYSSYLSGGGSLFLLGESQGCCLARDNSIASLVSGLGGGTVTLSNSGSLNNQTVFAPFTGPTAITSVQYAAVGGFTALGAGLPISKDSNNISGAAYWPLGSLSGASTGTVISALDVNIIFGSTAQPDFIDNLISYLNNPTSLTSQSISIIATPPSIIVGGTSTLSTSGTSGSGAISYSLVSGSCSINNNILSGTGVGSCSVTATIAADSTYDTATSAPFTVTVIAAPVAPSAPVSIPTLSEWGQIILSLLLALSALMYELKLKGKK